MNSKPAICIVDDNQLTCGAIRDVLHLAFKDEQFDIIIRVSDFDAITPDYVLENNIKLMILDYQFSRRVGNISGVSIAQILKLDTRTQHVALILVSLMSQYILSDNAVKSLFYSVLTKPCPSDRLIAAVSDALNTVGFSIKSD